MSKIHVHARNLLSNWVSFVANLAIMFFLSPFLVRNLGDDAYGFWSLAVSLTGYLGLMEIGVRTSTGRFINYYIGRGEEDRVSQVVNTSLTFYTAISVVLLGAGALLGVFFADIFPKFPAELSAQAKWIIVLLGLNIWVGFFTGTFMQLLQANDRFDLQNLVAVVVLVLRTAGTVAAILAGYGLVTLALVQVGSGVLGCVLLYFTTVWKGHPVRLGLRHFKWEMLRELFVFGTWVFVGNVGMRVISYFNAAIIGWLLGAKEITYYSIALLLVDYSHTLVGYLPRQILEPDLAKAAGRAAKGEMQWLMVKGSRLSMFLAVPVLVGFLVLGQEFIRLWMGPEYRQSSEILSILSLAAFARLANYMCQSVLNAIGVVRAPAILTGVEAVANILLSVVLVAVFKMGLVGIAIGTLIPMVIFEGVLLAWLTCRSMGMSLLTYFRQTIPRWALAAAILWAISLPIARLDWNGRWVQFLIKAAMICLVYSVIGWFLVLSKDERSRLAKMKRPALAPATPAGAGGQPTEERE